MIIVGDGRECWLEGLLVDGARCERSKRCPIEVVPNDHKLSIDMANQVKTTEPSIDLNLGETIKSKLVREETMSSQHRYAHNRTRTHRRSVLSRIKDMPAEAHSLQER